MSILDYDPENNAQDLVAVEPGEYTLRIIFATLQEGSKKNPDRNMLVISYEVVDNPFAEEVREWLTIPNSEDTDKAKNRMNLRLRDFQRAAGADLTVETPEELVGREIQAVLGTRVDDNGDTRNTVRSYLAF